MSKIKVPGPARIVGHLRPRRRQGSVGLEDTDTSLPLGAPSPKGRAEA